MGVKLGTGVSCLDRVRTGIFLTPICLCIESPFLPRGKIRACPELAEGEVGDCTTDSIGSWVSKSEMPMGLLAERHAPSPTLRYRGGRGEDICTPARILTTGGCR